MTSRFYILKSELLSPESTYDIYKIFMISSLPKENNCKGKRLIK
jgi:hypothetical protein